MKVRGFNNELHPGITMHKIPVKAGFPGLLFTIGTYAVFLMGIPALIYFFLFAIVLGIGFAVLLRFIPRQAGIVVFILTCVMVVSVAGIPSIDWPQKLPESMLLAAVVAPPPPEYGRLPLFRSDCRQRESKQPQSTMQRDQESQKRLQTQSAF